jgi:hypothetical protein
VLGTICGVGPVSVVVGCLITRRGISSMNGVVGRLCGVSSIKPALLRGRALKPILGMSIPALVNSPILSMSRLFRPAAISSRLFLAATIDAFSLVLSLFGLFAIACSLLLTCRDKGIADC